MKKVLIPVVMVGALVLLSGCVDHNELTNVVRPGTESPAGFWRGWWHGICAPFAFIGIMFGADVGVYEHFNTGNWYNFGFLIGCGGLIGIRWKSDK
jgi:hypothetical protein